MSGNFLQVAKGVDVSALAQQLTEAPDLWDAQPGRVGNPASPHRDSHDIWLRGAPELSMYLAPHDSVWLEPASRLPAALPLVFDLMRGVRATRLGGVLIYKLDAGKQIHKHVDRGWHADFYSKFMLCISNSSPTVFNYEDESFTTNRGDVFFFKNHDTHWVTNDGTGEYIVMVICVRVD